MEESHLRIRRLANNGKQGREWELKVAAEASLATVNQAQSALVK